MGQYEGRILICERSFLGPENTFYPGRGRAWDPRRGAGGGGGKPPAVAGGGDPGGAPGRAAPGKVGNGD
jgi:hypothetical protein